MTDDPRGNRLLVVDDEPSLGRLVKRIAESVGFETIATQDPTIFAQTARCWHPSVVIVDLNMPGTDGIALLRGLAEDECAAYVVLTSGGAGATLDEACHFGRECGLKMGKSLQKPVRMENLRELLREWSNRAA